MELLELYAEKERLKKQLKELENDIKATELNRQQYKHLRIDIVNGRLVVSLYIPSAARNSHWAHKWYKAQWGETNEEQLDSLYQFRDELTDAINYINSSKNVVKRSEP